jgi:hypothetical protein
MQHTHIAGKVEHPTQQPDSSTHSTQRREIDKSQTVKGTNKQLLELVGARMDAARTLHSQRRG